jgi:hypothetical protein
MQHKYPNTSADKMAEHDGEWYALQVAVFKSVIVGWILLIDNCFVVKL